MTKPKTKAAEAAPVTEAKAVEGELHDGDMPDEDNPDGISPEETTGAIVPLDTIDLPALLNSGAGTDDLIAKIRHVTTAIVPDMSTETGRKAVKSLAYRVSRTKSLFEEARLKHTEGLREQLSNINANGKKLVLELDKIRDEVKAPVVEWEEFETAYAEAMIEDARRDAEAAEAAEQFERDVQTRIDAWKNFPAAFLDDDMDLEKAEYMLVQARAVEFLPDQVGDRKVEAEQARDAAIAKVDKLLEMRRLLAKADADVLAAQQQAAADAQAKIDKAAAIDTEISNYRRTTLTKTIGLGSEDLRVLIEGVERTTFDPAFYGDRLGDAYTKRGELVDELRVTLTALIGHERATAEAEAKRVADEAAAEATRQAEAEALAKRQRRDDILGRIQGLQTTVMLAAISKSGDELQAMRDKFAARELDPAEWDDLLEQAVTSKTAALAKLDELITKERAAEADRVETARLRQERVDRELAEAEALVEQQERDALAATEEHREGIRTAAATALSVQLSMGENDARIAVGVIEQGLIPGVTLTF